MTYRPGTLIAVVTVLAVFTTLFVGLRAYARIKVVPSFGKDDAFMVMSWALYMAICGLIYAQVYHGLGKDSSMLSHAAIERIYTIIEVNRCTYYVNTAFTKISVGLLLMRLCVLQPIYKYFIYTAMTLICLVGTVLFVTALVQCSPPTPHSHGHCLGTDVAINMSYAFSAVNIACDWFYALLPVPMIWSTHLPTRIKISLFSVLGLGVVASSSRIVVLVTLIRSMHARDKLYAFSTTLIWAQIELGLAIIASSAATLRPLCRRFSTIASRKSSHASGRSHLVKDSSQMTPPMFEHGDV